MKLGIQEIYEAARAAGFTPDQATTWTAIALAESGGETGALNDSGEHSVGLWQINVSRTCARTSGATSTTPSSTPARRTTSPTTAWTCGRGRRRTPRMQGTSTDYRTYLDDVSAVTGYAGDNRGRRGLRFATARAALDPSAPTHDVVRRRRYDRSTSGCRPGANLDTDRDGLTDAFERLSAAARTSPTPTRTACPTPTRPSISQTSTMLADSDRDQASDSTEVALGTSPTAWDTDLDGFSDSVEAEYGTDPLRAEPGTQPAPPTEPVMTTAAAAMTSGMPRRRRPDCRPDQQHRGRHEGGCLRRGCPRPEGRRLRLRGGDRSRRHQPGHVRLLGADPVGRRPGRRDDP